MSALKDILDKMYVDPELLEQLNDEQKQLLFLKIREEQIRRWEQNEKMEEQEAKPRSRAKNNRSIKWLLGKDGEVWVWVMGEHPNDTPIEKIIEDEAILKAREIAEKEVLLESLKLDGSLSPNSNWDEEQLKKQLMQIKLNIGVDGRDSNNKYITQNNKNQISNENNGTNLMTPLRYSPYDEVNNLIPTTTTITTLNSNFSNNFTTINPPPTTTTTTNFINQQQKPLTYFENSPNKNNNENNNLSNNSNINRKNYSSNMISAMDYNNKNLLSPQPPPIPQRPAYLRRNGANPISNGQQSTTFIPSNNSEVEQTTRTYFSSKPTTNNNNNTKTTRLANNNNNNNNNNTTLAQFPTNNTTPSKMGFNIGGENVSRIAAQYSEKIQSPPQTTTTITNTPEGLESPRQYIQNFSKPFSTTISSYGVKESSSPLGDASSNSTTTSKWEHYDNNNLIDISNNSKKFEDDPMMRLRSILREHSPLQRQFQQRNIQQQQNNNNKSMNDSSTDNNNKTMNENNLLNNQQRNHIILPDDEIDKRQSKILEQIHEHRTQMEREAELEEQRQRLAWEEQERKARETETQIRLIAQKAREQHRKSLRTSASLLPVLDNDISNITMKDALKNLPRPPKPLNRQAIIDWYKRYELPNGTGLDPQTRLPAKWFHGIISRIESENLLNEHPTGAFLVRVSERIWGYTVSYMVGDGITKHFLVEKIPQGYQFLGTNQLVHSTLYDLIQYHKSNSITAKGKEILIYAIGQQSSTTTTTTKPDYADLIEN